jgi:virulence factor Mce-like protein
MTRPVLATRVLAIAALVAGAIVLLATVTRDNGASQHRLVATVDDATNLLAGQELKAGGGNIGTIEKLEATDRGRRARLTLRVDDDAWPLGRGTKFAVRFGGTATFYNRHILVTPAPRGAPSLKDGATIPAKDFWVPVEVDQLLASFDGGVRRDLKSFINRSGAALHEARGPFEGVLAKSPPAVDQAAAVMGDLVADRGALDAVVRRTDRVVDAVHRADPGVTQLVTGAARTFDAIASRQAELRTTLDRMPATLSQVQGTLAHADTTLDNAGSLARRIGPGVRQLRAVAGPVDDVLSSVQAIAPDASSALRSVRQAGPEINGLLERATALSPRIASVAGKSDEQMECIRPYTPEVMSLLMTWGDFHSWNDGKDKILRAQVQNFLPAGYNAVPDTPAEAAAKFPGLRYGFPRPPGYNAGQPWFLPQCGAGQDAVDPAKDQEANG